MAERIIIWIIFGFALSMTPLVIVAEMGWVPASGIPGFVRLLCNEEMLAVALTLGGAAAADVLISYLALGVACRKRIADAGISLPRRKGTMPRQS